MDEIVILAGAGVSAGWPSAVPAWKALNRLIVHALCDRIESGLQVAGWLADGRAAIDRQRTDDRFPPEYQAQVIEEMCGERYFRALQALDIGVINSAHDAIAALAATGRVKAIVTTNFDRLIELALERRGVPHVVAYDDDGFTNIGAARALPVIKIHGSVSDHLSMIDTLKQRRRGRSAALQQCLEPLHAAHWIYAGFSAADLDGNPDYLGLRQGAKRSAGATYIAFPGSPEPGTGAKLLLAAYGERGRVVIADVALHLNAMSGNDVEIAASEALGPALVEAGLSRWADSLTISAAALCLGAILEAIGEAELGVRIMDRIVRREYDERGTADYSAIQLHYGRLGAAWGRFVRVPDLSGNISNASVESMQSLFRIAEGALAFEARTWLIVALLWHDMPAEALRVAASMAEETPPSHEAAVDSWLAIAQLAIVQSGESMLQSVLDTFPMTYANVMRSGDAVRLARAVAMRLFVLAETTNDVPQLAREFDDEFKEAARLGDGFALGMLALAIGRWYAGSGRVAEQALAAVEQAMVWFKRQGMDPWFLFALFQRSKALADLGRFDDVTETMNAAFGMLDRFPVLASHYHETAGQLQAMVGDESARDSFLAAIDAATSSGFAERAARLQRYLR